MSPHTITQWYGDDRMNYIKEINAFYDRLETNPLSTSAIALWHALMHINNKAGWTDEFVVAVSVLSVKSGLSERTVLNARNELKQRGYIDFKSRKGNRSAIYKMNSLSANNADNFTDSNINKDLSVINADSVSDKLSDNASDSVSDNASALYKLNKTKLNEINKEKDNVFVFFQENGFGVITPHIKDQIDVWMDDSTFDEPESIILHAMKLAVEKNARNWSYVNKILMDWANRNLKTLDDVKAQQEQFWQSRQAISTKQKRLVERKQKVPDYILNQEKKYHANTVTVNENVDEEIDELLKKLGI